MKLALFLESMQLRWRLLLGLHEVHQRLDLGKRSSLKNSRFSSIFRGHSIGSDSSGNDVQLVHIIEAYHPERGVWGNKRIPRDLIALPSNSIILQVVR